MDESLLMPARPSRAQELIRRWILLIPLATAVVGAAAIESLPTDQYADLLPPIFFVGALIVTAAMYHQRSLLMGNIALNEEVRNTHERLDTLHHLALELSTTLNTAQVSQTVLRHTLQLAEGNCGALWLKTEAFPPQEMEALLALSTLDFTTDGEGEVKEADRPWRLFAVEGFAPAKVEQNRATLRTWQANLEKLKSGDLESTNVVSFPDDKNTMICIPIGWKGRTSGAILLQAQKPELPRESKVLLDDIAIIAGPSLQNALLYQAAAERAEIDGLTRLLNHRAIQERLGQEIARMARAHRTYPDRRFAIAVMDITDFKLFNDTYGHAVGDQVLRTVSACLKTTFRISDTVGRFGGDEFLALLPETPCSGSEILCARVISAVASQPFIAPDGSPITIRLTCGVASFPEDGLTPAELLKAADERLYAAKRKGELIVDESCSNSPTGVLTVTPEWNSIGLLDTLISTIDSKDHYTRAQSERVWRHALLIAHQMKFKPQQMQAMHFCALVHDVGKIVVPDAILRKPGRLSPDEFRIMQQHTIFGAMIVKDLPYLETILGAVRSHHEHWDGTGYPDGISGEEIPLLARILAVADSFSAMITPRPYRKALGTKQALDEIEREKGKQYDPVVVDAFRNALQSFSGDPSALHQVLLEQDVAHLCRIEMPETSPRAKNRQEPTVANGSVPAA